MLWRNRAAGVVALFAMGCGAAGSAPSRSNAASDDAHAAATHRTARVEPSRATHAERVVVAAPAPLRRLTNEEYNNTVRDLLGDASRPADAFPPDEVVGGFENNTVSPVTQVLVERYMGAAEALAAAAVQRVNEIAPCAATEPHEACARKFIDGFGRRAFRRPLDEGERASMLALFVDADGRAGYSRAVELTIEATLESPKFLYRLEPAGDSGATTRALNGYEIATRLSYFIWASTPDTKLLDAAAAGKLTAPDDIERAARRLLSDPRAVDGIRSFHRQWLDLRELETMSKDTALYPAFTPELKRAMVEETLRFSARAVLEGGDAVAALLTSKKTFVNAALAKLYGVQTQIQSPPGDGFMLVDLPPRERSGILTQASVMTLLASADEGSPILRGKFVREKLLCQPIPPPPPNVNISMPKFNPKVSKKDRFSRHWMAPSCAACHKLMDPIGFGFEHYDALGAWRTIDGELPVDAIGTLSWSGDAAGSFDGAVELGARLAASRDVRRCIATQWLRAAIGRSERDEDAASLDGIYQAFARSGFDVRELIVAITTSDSFRYASFDAGLGSGVGAGLGAGLGAGPSMRSAR